MKVQGLTPILNVSNLEQSFAWFEKLEWQKNWAYAFAIQQGLTVTLAPMNMEWNVRECHLRHPDGHTFRISCGLPEE